MSEKRSCGKHLELSTNSAVRVTQCPCGTVHVTFAASGVTLRMTEETMRGTVAGFNSAHEQVQARARPTIN